MFLLRGSIIVFEVGEPISRLSNSAAAWSVGDGVCRIVISCSSWNAEWNWVSSIFVCWISCSSSSSWGTLFSASQPLLYFLLIMCSTGSLDDLNCSLISLWILLYCSVDNSLSLRSTTLRSLASFSPLKGLFNMSSVLTSASQIIVRYWSFFTKMWSSSNASSKNSLAATCATVFLWSGSM